MFTNATGTLSPDDRAEYNTEETVDILFKTVREQQETIDELTNTVEEQQETIDGLRDDVDDITETVEEEPTLSVEDDADPLGSLMIDGLPLGPALRSKVTETDVEEMIDEYEPRGDETDGSNPTPKAGEDRVQTPLERVCGLPEHSVRDNLTTNQERARFVAQGVRDYGRKVPAGIGIRSSEIRRVLSASEESSIHTQTVTRVMDFLSELGGDDVQVRQTRSGERVVVFDEELADRITHVVTHEDGPPVIEAGI